MAADLRVTPGGNIRMVPSEKSSACSCPKVTVVVLGVITLLGSALVAWFAYAHIGSFAWTVLVGGAALGAGLMILGACSAPSSQFPVEEDSAAPADAPQPPQQPIGAWIPPKSPDDTTPYNEILPQLPKLRILGFLTGAELTHCRAVCSDWRDLIDTTQFLAGKVGRFVSALSEAKRVALSMETDRGLLCNTPAALSWVVRVEAGFNRRQALATARLIPQCLWYRDSPDAGVRALASSLVEVVKVMPGSNREQAIEILNEIRAMGPSITADVLLETGKVAVAIDPELARAILRDVQARARLERPSFHYLLEMAQVAKEIGNHELANEALLECKGFLPLIETHIDRFGSLLKIAQIAIGINLELAQEAFEEAKALSDDRFSPLYRIVEVEAALNPTQAPVILQEAYAWARSRDGGPTFQCSDLIGVSRLGIRINGELAKKALWEAKGLVQAIVHPYYEVHYLVDVLKVAVYIDHGLAEECLLEALEKVPSIVVDRPHREGRSLFYGIILILDAVEAVVDINFALAQECLSKVKALALADKSDRNRMVSLLRIARFEARFNPLDAIATLQEASRDAPIPIDLALPLCEALLEIAKH